MESAVQAANTPGANIPVNVSQSRKYHGDPPLEKGRLGPGMPVTNIVVNLMPDAKSFNLFLCYMTDEDAVGFRQVAEAVRKAFQGTFRADQMPLYTFNVHDWGSCSTAEIVKLREMHTEAWQKKHEVQKEG